MTKRPRGWVNVPSLYSTKNARGVSIHLGSAGTMVSPGNRDDVIRGGKGPDRIAGGGGDDNVIGGPGSDSLYGGGGTRDGGRDAVSGGPGKDLISAFDRRDTRATADTVQCGPGIDVVQADWNDTVGADCEYVFRGGRQVKMVRNLYRRSTSKAAALRKLQRMFGSSYRAR